MWKTLLNWVRIHVANSSRPVVSSDGQAFSSGESSNSLIAAKGEVMVDLATNKDVMEMANAIAALPHNVGITPDIIFAILMFVIQAWCKKPATMEEALAVINQRNKHVNCPIIFRPGFRHYMPEGRHTSIDDINELWGDMRTYTGNHPETVAKVLLTA